MNQNQKIIDTFEKSDTETVRISLMKWRSQVCVDVRIWIEKLIEFPYSDQPESLVAIPTRRGIRINVDHIDWLIEALRKVQGKLEKAQALEKQKRKK